LGFQTNERPRPILPPGTTCPHCAAKLEEFALEYAKFWELEAEILAISFDNIEKLNAYGSKLNIPFYLLSDEAGESTEKFTHVDVERKAPCPSIFTTDRFGALRHQEIASEAHELLDTGDILSWLLLVQTECPECSHL